MSRSPNISRYLRFSFLNFSFRSNPLEGFKAKSNFLMLGSLESTTDGALYWEFTVVVNVDVLSDVGVDDEEDIPVLTVVLPSTK